MASGKTELKRLQKQRKPKKVVRRKKPNKRSFSFAKHIVFPILLISFLYGSWHYRYAIYYLIFQRIEKTENIKVANLTTQMRIFDVLQHHQKKQQVFGIDISHYQGKIDWVKATKIQDSFPISFVFIHATAGSVKTDRKFKHNWKHAKKQNIIRGAYHYYRPNENSILQANNFIKTVKLKTGDLPPVLDIEDIPRIQSMENLKLGLKKWLLKVEKHYGIKPIIYSGESFYNDFLYNEFPEYTCWVANYNFYVENMDKDWNFWQFTDKGSVNGIKEFVDVNIYNGTHSQLLKLTKK